MLFTIYPQLDFATQIMNIVLVGAKEGDHFIKRVGMRFHSGPGLFPRLGLRPFSRPEPESLHIEGGVWDDLTIQVYDAMRIFTRYFVPVLRKLQVGFILKDEILAVFQFLHVLPFPFLVAKVECRSSGAILGPYPYILPGPRVKWKIGLSILSIFNGQCFIPAGI